MTYPRILEAIRVLQVLGVHDASTGIPSARDGLALLALLTLTPSKHWTDAVTPTLSASAIATFPAAYGFRPHPGAATVLEFETLPAFCAAGIVCVNPDAPGRPRWSPHTVYQVPYPICEMLQAFGSPSWLQHLRTFKGRQGP